MGRKNARVYTVDPRAATSSAPPTASCGLRTARSWRATWKAPAQGVRAWLSDVLANNLGGRSVHQLALPLRRGQMTNCYARMSVCVSQAYLGHQQDTPMATSTNNNLTAYQRETLSALYASPTI